jgi:aspartyl/asparaginyl-tRNA synthetase
MLTHELPAFFIDLRDGSQVFQCFTESEKSLGGIAKQIRSIGRTNTIQFYI